MNHRFRGATITYDELITALENIILDESMTAQILKQERQTRSAPWTLEWQRKATTMERKMMKGMESQTSQCMQYTEVQDTRAAGAQASA